MFVTLLGQGQPSRVFAVTQSSGVALQTALAECTAFLVCTQVAGSTLPQGDLLVQAGSIMARGAPIVWLTTTHVGEQQGAFRVWAYDTKLSKLSEWTSLETAMRRIGAVHGTSNVSITNLGAQLAALVDVDGARAVVTSPDTQRWTAETTTKRAFPRPGQLPASGTSTSPYYGHWLAGGANRLFTVGQALTSTFAGESIYCSSDGGRHWYTHC
ncbi:MAG: hypothetical protein JO079_03905 [Frankiaceae bacterium]|nr:hypothetical protein [Frankiaceae bacterium]MBV9369779.1 hypothetical protein [Frankiales bacterium]